ncbi:12631_t:CDS:1, partial [Dentiscutata heterogama]
VVGVLAKEVPKIEEEDYNQLKRYLQEGYIENNLDKKQRK